MVLPYYLFFFLFQQEPEANGTEILNAIKYVRPGGGYVPNFQMFKLVDVNGKDEIPLYTYLKVCFVNLLGVFHAQRTVDYYSSNIDLHIYIH